MTQKELDILNNKRYILIDTSNKNDPIISYGELYNNDEPNACIIAFISILSELIVRVTPSNPYDSGQYNIYTDKLIKVIRKGIKAAVDLKISLISDSNKSNVITNSNKNKRNLFSTKILKQ